MSDVQTNEPTQTKIDNQNVKTDDDASKYSSTTLQTDNRELDQTTIESKAMTTKSTKDATTSEPSFVLKHDTSTTHKPDTDTNNSVTATVAQETSSAPDLDANKQSLPNEAQPENTTKPSEAQIPESDANRQSSPTEVPPFNTATPSASQIPETDANKQSPPTEVQPINTQEISTTQETSTTEAPGSKANKQPLPTKVQQASVVGSSTSQPTAEQERTIHRNLISQELTFLKSIWQIHQEHMNKEIEYASEKFKYFDESCEIEELKNLKKTITKLKLKIRTKYRTYDENELRKKQQSDVEKRDIIQPTLLNKMPLLHTKLLNDSEIFKTIQKRYSELPTRELKICLLCFSVFPENEIISRRLMVYWWIGEGLTPEDEDLKKGCTAEDHANAIFNELMDKGFIDPISKIHGHNVATCKMNPLVRSVLIIIANMIGFFDFDEYGDPKDFGKFDEINSPEEIQNIHPLGDPREFFDFYDKNHKETTEKIEFADQNGNPTTFDALPPTNKELDNKEPFLDSNGKQIDTTKKYYFYRRKEITTRSCNVCLMGSGLSEGIKWEKLHTLFNVKDDILEFKREWLLRMKNVNVLFLGRWKRSPFHHIEVEEFDFKASFEHMNHVRFFSLQGVSRIIELPKSISKLKSLIILDLRACHNLEVIPSTIGSLIFLTHLDMSECYWLKYIPKEISSLVSLQVLKGFVVVDYPQSHVCAFQDLGKLKNLIKLNMYTPIRDFPRGSHLEALQKFEMLRKLTITWVGFEKAKPNQPETPKKEKMNFASRVRRVITKKIWVQGSMRRMNAFNNSILGSRLEKLDLKCFPHNYTPIWLTPVMLQGLKKLYIRGGQISDLGQYQDIYEMGEYQTWNVLVLRLKYMDELTMEWKELQNLFPKMISLEKVKCPGLTLFPCNERGVWNKETTTT